MQELLRGEGGTNGRTDGRTDGTDATMGNGLHFVSRVVANEAAPPTTDRGGHGTGGSAITLHCLSM